MQLINFTSLQSLKIAILLMLLSSIAFAQSEDQVVAIVNDRVIRQSEVDHLLIAQVMALEEQLYAIRKASLENLVVTVLLESEAKKRGVSLSELRKTFTAGRVEVKWSEVERAYSENLSAFGAMSPDEVRERLRLDLETQALMAKYKRAVEELKQRSVVKVLLSEPRWPWRAIADDSPSLGLKGSKVTIIEYADFECSYCRQSQEVVKRLLKEYGNDIRLIFKHLPLHNDSLSVTAARAAFCAGKEDRFWEYHEALFALPKLGLSDLKRAARDLKLDLSSFEVCLSSDQSQMAVDKDKRQAAVWGINTTPTFIVNGKIVRGAIDFETFRTLIEQNKPSAHLLPRTSEPVNQVLGDEK